MRTTLTLDDDVAAELERLRRERGVSLGQVVNEAIRRGLEHVEGSHSAGEQFDIEPISSGGYYLDDLDDISEVLAKLEGENYRRASSPGYIG